jgi:hypothetical protein
MIANTPSSGMKSIVVQSDGDIASGKEGVAFVALTVVGVRPLPRPSEAKL